MPKKKLTPSIEDIYCNKLFVPPKEKNLETIFEEPRQGKDGTPVLTSVKKYKRYLHFDPSQNKIQKRKRNAKKCLKKLKSNYRVTRSSPGNLKRDDISYILDMIGDTSSDSEMDDSNAIGNKARSSTIIDNEQSSGADEHLITSEGSVSCADLCDTPKKIVEPRSSLPRQDEDIAKTTNNIHETPDTPAAINAMYNDAEKTNAKNDTDETLESPRRSCCIS